LAVENGAPIDDVIAFATPLVSTQQWEMLASFMDKHQITRRVTGGRGAYGR
jgi:hypothetical protein